MQPSGESNLSPKAVNISVGFGSGGYEPDAEFNEISERVVPNPVQEFNKALLAGQVEVEEAWLYEGRVDHRGKMVESSVPYRVRHVSGAEFKEAIKRADGVFLESKLRADRLEEAKRKHLAAVESLKESKLLEDGFDTDVITTAYAPQQYTEFIPLYGGPFNKQLYQHDYLSMHAKAFQARNHNPIAKRIVDVFTQYSFGRRFKVRIKDERKKKVWDEFDAEHRITHKFSEFWIREYLTYGELMIDKLKWQSIDPSTVWDIITDPDDISQVFYYYQSYSTAYQTFTGYKVKGEPGSDKAAPEKFIIRQLPASQVIHTRGNVVSQEKRGRSILFSILGWLKRINDLYNAEVIRAQLQASFIWDDEIKGNAADVQAHAATYSTMPVAASVFAHNEAVKRTAMPAIASGGARGSAGVSDELLAFIATAVGLPKEFFNVMGSGGGNRATALVSAEPFEKAVEDLQAKGENVLLAIAEHALTEAGLTYEKGDVEFTFPSVTKDTTTETIKNIGTGQTMGWISDETSAEMYAAEMNITTYDYDTEKKKIGEDKKNGIDPLMPPVGRFGANGSVPKDGSVPDDVSPIHGTGKKNLKGQLNRV